MTTSGDNIIVTPVINQITVASPGPQGPAGAFTPSDIAYTHTQAVASAVWTINHNLGFNPDSSSFRFGWHTMRRLSNLSNRQSNGDNLYRCIHRCCVHSLGDKNGPQIFSKH
jgi:hypothetical protein